MGIGTSSPLGLLQLNSDNGNGEATNRGNLILVNQTGTGIGSTKGIELKGSTSGAGYGVKLYMNNDSDYFGIATRFSSATWTERLAISQNNGNVTLTNNLSVGGATPTTSGTGITFPATQSASTNANTLDDYEEGTFTATLKGSTSDPTTPVTTTGVYTKVGNLVTVNILFSNVTTTGAAGEVSVNGLPFTSASSPQDIGSVMCYQFNFNGLTSVCSYVPGNGTQTVFQVSGNNAAWQPLLHNAGTVRYIWTSVTYRV